MYLVTICLIAALIDLKEQIAYIGFIREGT